MEKETQKKKAEHPSLKTLLNNLCQLCQSSGSLAGKIIQLITEAESTPSNMAYCRVRHPYPGREGPRRPGTDGSGSFNKDWKKNYNRSEHGKTGYGGETKAEIGVVHLDEEEVGAVRGLCQ